MNRLAAIILFTVSHEDERNAISRVIINPKMPSINQSVKTGWPHFTTHLHCVCTRTTKNAIVNGEKAVEMLETIFMFCEVQIKTTR